MYPDKPNDPSDPPAKSSEPPLKRADELMDLADRLDGNIILVGYSFMSMDDDPAESGPILNFIYSAKTDLFAADLTILG